MRARFNGETHDPGAHVVTVGLTVADLYELYDCLDNVEPEDLSVIEDMLLKALGAMVRGVSQRRVVEYPNNRRYSRPPTNPAMEFAFRKALGSGYWGRD